MPERKLWRLVTRRGVSNGDGRLKPHAPSRHQVIEEGLIDPDAHFTFGQGTLFPRHVRAGDIKEIERFVQEQWVLYSDGKLSAVCSCQAAGDAIRIAVRLDKFGVRKVGAFIRLRQVVTVFPEEATGSSRIFRRNVPVKKSSK